MIKLKKIVAVALSAAMCLGLSMTAFAAKETVWSEDALWSPNTLLQQGPGSNGQWVQEAGQWVWKSENNAWQPVFDANGAVIGWESRFTNARDAKGHSVDISWRELSDKTLKSIDSEEKVSEIFKKNGYDVPDDTDFIPLLNGNITFDEGVPEGGGIVTFQLADLGVNPEGVRAGETVYVMQETSPGSGVWEVYAAEVGQNLDVVVTLPRNGALVLVKTLSDGTVITVDKTTGNVIDRKPADNTANNNAANNNANNNASGSTSTSSVAAGATSPKTGEF